MKRNAYPSLQGNRIQEEHSLSLSHTHKHMPENCSSLSSFLSLPPLLSLSVYVPHFFDNLSAYILWNVDGTRRDIRMRVNQNPSIKIPSEMNNQTNCWILEMAISLTHTISLTLSLSHYLTHSLLFLSSYIFWFWVRSRLQEDRDGDVVVSPRCVMQWGLSKMSVKIKGWEEIMPKTRRKWESVCERVEMNGFAFVCESVKVWVRSDQIRCTLF